MLQANLQKREEDGDETERVCLGVITSPVGVRGELRIKPFTSQPENIAAYGEVSTEGGEQVFQIESLRLQDGMVVARLSGVSDRDAAKALSGTHLYVSRAALPELEEEEWYHAELLGLSAQGADGEDWGEVKAVWDFGAGDMLELQRTTSEKQSILIPFTKENVAEVDIAGGKITLTEMAKRFPWQRA